jgi:hypothetical protein
MGTQSPRLGGVSQQDIDIHEYSNYIAWYWFWHEKCLVQGSQSIPAASKGRSMINREWVKGVCCAAIAMVAVSAAAPAAADDGCKEKLAAMMAQLKSVSDAEPAKPSQLQVTVPHGANISGAELTALRNSIRMAKSNCVAVADGAPPVKAAPGASQPGE